jgi:hypothetical protein
MSIIRISIAQGTVPYLTPAQPKLGSGRIPSLSRARGDKAPTTKEAARSTSPNLLSLPRREGTRRGGIWSLGEGREEEEEEEEEDEGEYHENFN